MRSVEFCYWLQGLFELGKPTALSEEQTALIKAHLEMVFVHEIDPSYPAEQKAALDAAHAGIGPLRLHPDRQGWGETILRC